MRATVFYGPGEIRVVEVADSRIRDPHDAIVTITHTCICGSDLWAYRGVARRAHGQPIGHEFVGVVAEVGAAVRKLQPGDHVVSPFSWSDGECAQCVAGWQTSCAQGGFWGRTPGADGAQAEQIRVPQADGTLVVVPANATLNAAALLTLSDVLCTGHHAAVSAGVSAGMTVAVIGDGAVGMCAVLAAARLGASRIVLVARHESRSALARRFGATDVVISGRGDPGEEGANVVTQVRELIGDTGTDATLECVGTEAALRTAVAIAQDGSTVGMVGVPHEVEKVPIGAMFRRNVALRAGVAPARRYIPELLPEVLSGALNPTPVFDLTLPLDEIAQGYAAMADRRAIKVLVQP